MQTKSEFSIDSVPLVTVVAKPMKAVALPDAVNKVCCGRGMARWSERAVRRSTHTQTIITHRCCKCVNTVQTITNQPVGFERTKK